MGRTKLKIRKLESAKARQLKYSKRKFGILKKAKELATLCEVDVALVMFSPTGKPSHYAGENKDLSAILHKFSKLSIHEKEKRKAYTMKKLLAKIKAKGDPEEAEAENQAIDRGEELESAKQQLKEVKEKLEEKRKILRGWKNPYYIDTLEETKIMEDGIKITLQKLKNLKIQLREQQNMAG